MIRLANKECSGFNTIAREEEVKVENFDGNDVMIYYFDNEKAFSNRLFIMLRELTPMFCMGWWVL